MLIAIYDNSKKFSTVNSGDYIFISVNFFSITPKLSPNDSTNNGQCQWPPQLLMLGSDRGPAAPCRAAPRLASVA